MEHCKSIQLCSSSSSSSATAWKYDVFVSFRGEDIRYTFADQLFFAFQKKGIAAFRDDTHLKQGDHISTELVEAIEGSHVLMVIFTKNYATSTWCLEELAKFVDCITKVPTTGQNVLPVFYDVSPSEVRKQSGKYYGKAFDALDARFKDESGMVRRWREALAEVANLSGWNVHNKPQHIEIEKIVERVMNIKGYKVSSFDGLVGMHSRVKQLENLLDLDHDDDVRVIGIHGMGGIGKTTLARAVYDKIQHQYDGCCYIDDISKVYNESGTIGAQKQLICQVVNEENHSIWNVSKGTYLIKNRLRHMKTLIVLDNVDKEEQLDKLALGPECLCEGSRIIVISRDRHILNYYGVNEVYDAELMDQDEAHELFCRKAFKNSFMSCDKVNREYINLIDLALKYAQGLPLAIEVLGSFLCGKDISEWKSALARLRDNPKKDIMDVLQISYDGLDPKEKEIFLDIACLFENNDDRDYVTKVLDCFRFEPTIGLRILIDKSLIKIRDSIIGDSLIEMHDKLRELGQNIVRQQAPNEPWKWSRLWKVDDFHDIMHLKMAMDNLEAIHLSYNRDNKKVLSAEVLSRMKRLRFLNFSCGLSFAGSLSCLSNELCYLSWTNYPFTYFPSNCELSKLVELYFDGSNVKQLWEGLKPMYHLKVMNLRNSENLVKTPDFGGTPNLERLELKGCTKLTHIHPSIGNLKKLIHLDLRDCTGLTSLSNNIFNVLSLEVVLLKGCLKLIHSTVVENSRNSIRDVAIQCLSATSIFKRLKLMLPSGFLESTRHDDVVDSLKPSLCHLRCLRQLDLSYCNLVNLPDAMAELFCLERLDLAGNNFVTLPSFIKELPRLISLRLEHCKHITSSEFPLSNPVMPMFPNMDTNPGLRMFNCPKFVETGGWSSIALSWMIQILKVNKETSPRITIVIPGIIEMPSWFKCLSEGGEEIRLEPSPDVNDNNWIGVAFCATFVAQYHPPSPSDDGANREHRSIWCESHYGQRGRGYLVGEVETEGDVGELDHFCIVFFHRRSLTNLMKQGRGRYGDGCLRFLLSPQLSHVELKVKHCGVRIVYKHDLEEVGSNE